MPPARPGSWSTRHSVPGAVDAFSHTHRQRPRRLEAGLCIVEFLVVTLCKGLEAIVSSNSLGVEFPWERLFVRMRTLREKPDSDSKPLQVRIDLALRG